MPQSLEEEVSRNPGAPSPGKLRVQRNDAPCSIVAGGGVQAGVSWSTLSRPGCRLHTPSRGLAWCLQGVLGEPGKTSVSAREARRRTLGIALVPAPGRRGCPGELHDAQRHRDCPSRSHRWCVALCVKALGHGLHGLNKDVARASGSWIAGMPRAGGEGIPSSLVIPPGLR